MARPSLGVRGAIEADPDALQNDIIEKQRIEESRLIKGIFTDLEVKGGVLKFVFRKFKGDPVEEYELKDGCEYTLPLRVVKHLNHNCSYVEDAYVNGMVTATGAPMKNPNPKRKPRFSFTPMEF